MADPKFSARDNPYYAMLLDRDDHWLNSHFIGIDGVMLHFDKQSPRILHIWLLSFERHALVSHFTVKNQNWGAFFQKSQ